jgi:hypothetical protein
MVLRATPPTQLPPPSQSPLQVVGGDRHSPPPPPGGGDRGPAASMMGSPVRRGDGVPASTASSQTGVGVLQQQQPPHAAPIERGIEAAPGSSSGATRST